MKSVLVKSMRISSEVCIITKPLMVLAIIKTKLYFHSIFHSTSEEVPSLVSVCHGVFFPAAAKMLWIVESNQAFAFSIIQTPSI